MKTKGISPLPNAGRVSRDMRFGSVQGWSNSCKVSAQRASGLSFLKDGEAPSPSSWGKVTTKAKYDRPFLRMPHFCKRDGPVTSRARKAQQRRAGFGLQSRESGPEPPEVPWEGWGQCPQCPQETTLQRQHVGTTRNVGDTSWWRWLQAAPGLWVTWVP